MTSPGFDFPKALKLGEKHYRIDDGAVIPMARNIAARSVPVDQFLFSAV